MATRTRKTARKPQPPRRRMEDRVPGAHGMSVGIQRRGAEIPARPAEGEALFGAAPGMTVRVGMGEGVIHIVAELPGMNAGDITVSVTEDSLTLRGVHCRFGPFDQVIRLPETVGGDPPRIAADRTQLRIDLPRMGDAGLAPPE